MSKRGFASFSPEQRKAIARKGGSVKVPKGFARMDKERLKEVSRKGGSMPKTKPTKVISIDDIAGESDCPIEESGQIISSLKIKGKNNG